MNTSKWWACTLLLAAAAAWFVGGCSRPAASPDQVSYVDELIQELHNLGWLGARAQPATKDIAVTDPDDPDHEIHPGGLVLREVDPDGPLSQAGLLEGDVLVGVGDRSLPNKFDPTLDFVSFLEQEVSGEQPSVEIRYLRGGDLNKTSVAIELEPLETGLPLSIARFEEATERGLRYLQSQQQPDGGFAPQEAAPESRLMTASVAGLAFLANGAKDAEHPCHVNWEQCDRYLAAESPRLREAPLAQAYSLMCTSESFDQPIDPARMQRAAECLTSIQKTQDDSGGWMVSTFEESDGTPLDVEGTFATNQVMLALSVAERNGLKCDDEMIKRGVTFLKEQARRSVASDVDRRVKSGLAAGTTAALLGLQVDRNAPFLNRLVKDSRRHWPEIYSSPCLSIPHLLSFAVASRQLGVPAWIDFHGHSKYLLASLQDRQGRFRAYPGADAHPSAMLATCRGDVWRTAHFVLAMELQSDAAGFLSGEKLHPVAVARAGDGGPRSPDAGHMLTGLPGGAIPEGAQVIRVEGGNLEDIMEKLKEQGIEIDSSSIQIGEGPPGGDKQPPPP